MSAAQKKLNSGRIQGGVPMKRFHILSVMLVLLMAVIGMMPDTVAQNKRCLVLYEQAFEIEPADGVVFLGEEFLFKTHVNGRQGQWMVSYSLLSDVRGFDRIGTAQFSLVEGADTAITTRIKVLESLEPGTYDLRIVAAGAATNCTGTPVRNSTYHFQVEVRDFASSFSVTDDTGDLFNQLSGEDVNFVDVAGVDIMKLDGQRFEDRLRLTFQMDGRLLTFSQDAPRQIGCFIDTNNDASLNAPFEPVGFEYLLLNNWRPDATFVQLLVLANETNLSNSVSAQIDGNTLTNEIALSGLNNAESVNLLCFSEYNGAVDVIPSSGLLNL
jgi:hypothetical protein